MNMPPFRPAGAIGRLATPKFSRLKLMLLGGAAVAMAAAGLVIVGMSEPDTTQTAAVPPHVTLPAGVSAAPADAEGGEMAKQARSTATRMPAPLASDTARLEAPATPAAAEPPSEQIVAGPEQRELIAAAQASPQHTTTTPDATDTASIQADGLRGPLDVQVAESEAEIAKLETATGMTEEPTAGSETRPAPAAPANTKLAAVSQPDLKPATVTKHVNLREGPADEAVVITVVPANAKVEAETDCGWCTVVYKGQRGYIYKSFIDRGAAKEATAPAEGQGLY